MSRKSSDIQLEDEREKKSWNFLKSFKNEDDYLCYPVAFSFIIWMVIGKRRTSITQKSFNEFIYEVEKNIWTSFSLLLPPLWLLTKHSRPSIKFFHQRWF